jgi:hypothetical protein
VVRQPSSSSVSARGLSSRGPWFRKPPAAAGNGDLQAAKALIPWLNQALGMPTERVEHRRPSRELEQMDEEQLERLVAQGRRKRMKLVGEAEPTPDWRARDS